MPTSLSLGSKAKLGNAPVEDDELALQEGVAQNVEADAAAILDTTEAVATSIVERSVVDQASGQGDGLTTDVEGEVRQRGRAREDHATPAIGVLSTRDEVVVAGDQCCGKPVDALSPISKRILS